MDYLQWIIDNADRIGLALALIVAAYLKWRSAREGAAKTALMRIIEDEGQAVLQRAIHAVAEKAKKSKDKKPVAPMVIIEATRSAIKREVEAKAVPEIDKTVAALFPKKK